jgi:hypothetical protein
VVSRSGTILVLDLDEQQKLKRSFYQWNYGFMRVQRSLTKDHCTGQHFVDVSVQAPAKWGGALVLVDGVVVGRLGTHSSAAVILVETGSRTIALRSDSAVQERTIELPRAGSGLASVIFTEPSEVNHP